MDALDSIWEASRKRFDDAIYRAKHGEVTTAEELWAELAVAQESTEDGLVSGLRCMGILNQLKRRGQVML